MNIAPFRARDHPLQKFRPGLCEGGNHFYPFGYEDYLEQQEKASKEAFEQEHADRKSHSVKNGQKNEKLMAEFQKAATANTLHEQRSKQRESDAYYNPGKEQSKLERRIKKIEEQLETCETELQKQKDELQNPELTSDYVRLQEIQNSIDEREEQLLSLMSEWDELQSMLTEA